MEFLYNVYVLEVMLYGFKTIANYSILTKDDQGQVKKRLCLFKLRKKGVYSMKEKRMSHWQSENLEKEETEEFQWLQSWAEFCLKFEELGQLAQQIEKHQMFRIQEGQLKVVDWERIEAIDEMLESLQVELEQWRKIVSPRLNMKELKQKRMIVSTEDALKDVEPFMPHRPNGEPIIVRTVELEPKERAKTEFPCGFIPPKDEL